MATYVLLKGPKTPVQDCLNETGLERQITISNSTHCILAGLLTWFNQGILHVRFSYLGIVFTSGGSCKEAQRTLAGQALKASFALNKYLYKFTYLKPSHVLDLFDKLISPILNYGSEVWGFHKAVSIETIHMRYCKKLLSVKQSSQNDFVYGELHVGRLNYQVQRYTNSAVLVKDNKLRGK